MILKLFSIKAKNLYVGKVCIFVNSEAPFHHIIARLIEINDSEDIDRYDENYETFVIEDPYELYRTPHGIIPYPYLIYAQPTEEIQKEDGRIARRFRFNLFDTVYYVFLAHPQLAEQFDRGFVSSDSSVIGPNKKIVTPFDLRSNQ
jgi:hypothetical protein